MNNREEKSSYSITLQAKDMGEEIQLESTAELVVDILDSNDNAPVLVNGREEILVSYDLDIGMYKRGTLAMRGPILTLRGKPYLT